MSSVQRKCLTNAKAGEKCSDRNCICLRSPDSPSNLLWLAQSPIAELKKLPTRIIKFTMDQQLSIRKESGPPNNFSVPYENIIDIRENSFVVNKCLQFYANNYSCVQWDSFNNYSVVLLLKYFVELLKENCELKSFVQNLVTKINKLELDRNVENQDKDCKICSEYEKTITKLTGEYDQLSKKYSLHQSEKEKMVMKYATSEKRLIEVQRSMKLVETKHQDLLKEKNLLKKKFVNEQENNAKLTSELNSKNTEIIRLQNQIMSQKENENSSKIKLKWTQKRLESLLESYQESQKKLNEATEKIAELNKICEKNQYQSIGNMTRTSNVDLDKEHPHQNEQTLNNSHESHDLDSEELKKNLSGASQSTIDKNSSTALQIDVLKKECTEIKSKLIMSNSQLETERKETASLRNQLAQAEALLKKLESNEQRITEMEIELKKLSEEKEELISEIEAYRQHEIQILDFTQKLTDRNVQLQCEFTNLQSEFNRIANDQNPLHKSIEEYINKIKKLENNLNFESIKRAQDSEILGKYVAELTYYNKKLSRTLEYLEGENLILKKKYQLAVREMTKEMHLYIGK